MLIAVHTYSLKAPRDKFSTMITVILLVALTSRDWKSKLYSKCHDLSVVTTAYCINTTYLE